MNIDRLMNLPVIRDVYLLRHWRHLEYDCSGMWRCLDEAAWARYDGTLYSVLMNGYRDREQALECFRSSSSSAVAQSPEHQCYEMGC